MDDFSEEIEKIGVLLQNPDLEYVKTGLELVRSLFLEPDHFKILIGDLSVHKNSLVSDPKFESYPHFHFIALWFLGEQADLGLNATIRHLNLSNKGLIELPLNIGAIHITSLDLSENEFSEFPLQLLEIKTLRHLALRPKRYRWNTKKQKMYFSQVAFEQIDEWLFQDPFLFRSDLNPQRSITVDKDFDQRFQSRRISAFCQQIDINPDLNILVERLDFSNCSILDLPNNLPNLQSIETILLPTNINDQEAQSLFPLLAQLPNLRTVIFSLVGVIKHPKLPRIPEEIGLLTQVTTLQAESCRLPSLPKNLGKMNNLSVLQINRNNISYFPEEYSALTNLRILQADNNTFRIVPTVFDSFVAIQEIHLSTCKIHQMNLSFEGLSQLTFLNLSNNQLSSLPEGMGRASALNKLILSGNKLTTLPESLSHLNLERLRLRNNPLLSLPSDLSALAIDAAQWKKLQPQIFRLNNLRYLSLDKVGLTDLPKQLKKLSQLTFLSIRNNPIQNLPDWLEELKQLEHISCQHTLVEYANLPPSFRDKVHIRDRR